ncbi:MIP/aquaporin family protein [Blattabacterium cuenoti]|uniref:MIP/aquaporin family protein n=1 Tax=Blattabacterium cuenoti TaxID=1653831 RepID=UPI00163C40B1|nr:MIP/aquaporin family protein [Blattabacterium cuenoti]
MTKIYAEIIGTMILIFLGNGVVANVVLSKTKGHSSKSAEWIIIALGWALAVFMGIIVSAPYSGAHMNPCVTISFAIIGKFDWEMVPYYIVSQLIGAMLGSLLVWLLYKDHFLATENEQEKLSVFVTVPSIKNFFWNFLSEVLATFFFIFISLYLTKGTILLQGQKHPVGIGSLEALPASLVVLGIILSLGGATGAAINPVRDMGPRIIYSIIILICGKGKNNWDYAFIPVIGPIFGSVLAAMFYLFLSNNL